MKNDIKAYNHKSDRYKIALMVFCVFLITFIFNMLKEPDTSKYLYDSADYYRFSQNFLNEGQFSLQNFGESYRGYLFPFILYFYTFAGEFFGLSHAVSILIGTCFFFAFIAAFVLVCPPKVAPLPMLV